MSIEKMPQSRINHIDKERVHDTDIAHGMALSHDEVRNRVLKDAEEMIAQDWEEQKQYRTQNYKHEMVEAATGAKAEAEFKKDRWRIWKKIADSDGEQAALEYADRQEGTELFMELSRQFTEELESYDRLARTFRGFARSVREKRRTLENPEAMKYLSTERVAEEYCQLLNLAYQYRTQVIESERRLKEIMRMIEQSKNKLGFEGGIDWMDSFKRCDEVDDLI